MLGLLMLCSEILRGSAARCLPASPTKMFGPPNLSLYASTDHLTLSTFETGLCAALMSDHAAKRWSDLREVVCQEFARRHSGVLVRDAKGVWFARTFDGTWRIAQPAQTVEPFLIALIDETATAAQFAYSCASSARAARRLRNRLNYWCARHRSGKGLAELFDQAGLAVAAPLLAYIASATVARATRGHTVPRTRHASPCLPN